MNRLFLIIAVIALCFALAACGGKESVSLGDIDQYQPGTEDIDVGDEVPGNILVRQDEFGLVTVYIENGSAEVMLDSDLWKKMFNIEENMGPEAAYAVDFISDGPWPVEGLSGRVSDAVVGYVEGIDYYTADFLATPTVALLMEDGTVEYFLASPFVADGPGEYHSNGRLPWITDVISLSFDYQVDGYGAMTIYAEKADGNKYDIQYVTGLTNIFDGVWECFMPDEWGGEYYCNISFTEDYKVELNVGDNYDGSYEIFEQYSGMYDVYLEALGDGSGEALMYFTMFLDWWIAELGEDPDEDDLEYWYNRQDLIGEYYFYFNKEDFTFNLYLSKGDALMYTGWRGEPIKGYSFWQTSFH